jgi:hypothetical protein
LPIRSNVAETPSVKKSFQSFLILEICVLYACAFHQRAQARHAEAAFDYTKIQRCLEAAGFALASARVRADNLSRMFFEKHDKQKRL